jgi:hypothetical protein
MALLKVLVLQDLSLVVLGLNPVVLKILTPLVLRPAVLRLADRILMANHRTLTVLRKAVSQAALLVVLSLVVLTLVVLLVVHRRAALQIPMPRVQEAQISPLLVQSLAARLQRRYSTSLRRTLVNSN